MLAYCATPFVLKLFDPVKLETNCDSAGTPLHTVSQGTRSKRISRDACVYITHSLTVVSLTGIFELGDIVFCVLHLPSSDLDDGRS